MNFSKTIEWLVPLPPLSEQECIVSEIEKIFSQIDTVKENQGEINKLKEGLKNKILDLAIKGKLVEQDPNDEPASVLLEKIKEETTELVKQGKIKKDKQESYIFKGPDNRHYEKIGSETKDITDEIPFEIPNNWEWVRLGQVCQLINGDRGKNYPSKDKLMDKGDIPFISAINISENTISSEKLLYLRQEQYEKLGSGKLQKNDIVVCIRGSLGKVCLYPFDKVAIASSLVILRAYTAISERFLISYINSVLFASEMKRYDNGTAQPNLAANDLYKFLIPLPPTQEQGRIVEKLKSLSEIIVCL